MDIYMWTGLLVATRIITRLCNFPQLHRDLVSSSSLFWSSDPQLYYNKTHCTLPAKHYSTVILLPTLFPTAAKELCHLKVNLCNFEAFSELFDAIVLFWEDSLDVFLVFWDKHKIFNQACHRPHVLILICCVILPTELRDWQLCVWMLNLPKLWSYWLSLKRSFFKEGKYKSQSFLLKLTWRQTEGVWLAQIVVIHL